MTFAESVALKVEKLYSKMPNNLMIKSLTPIINTGKKILYIELKENPPNVYKWLVFVRNELNKLIRIFDNENKSK